MNIWNEPAKLTTIKEMTKDDRPDDHLGFQLLLKPFDERFYNWLAYNNQQAINRPNEAILP